MAPTTKDSIHLFTLSFLLLFVELMLIRWSSANIVYISFFSNFILLASFLGISLGFLRKESSTLFFWCSPSLICLFIFLCYHFRFSYIIHLIPFTQELDYRGMDLKNNQFPIFITLPILFLVVTGLMSVLAGGVATVFKNFPPLHAYRLNSAGSLSGIILFSLLSWTQTAPVWWGIIVTGLYFILFQLTSTSWRIIKWQIIAFILMIFIFILSSQNALWSPYYKIEIKPFLSAHYVINVNGLPQQVIESVDSERTKPFYFIPYERAIQKKWKNILIIGAGTGGDAAIAVHQGAENVDAVEIDPLLYQIGKHYHPNHPYADPRVTVYIQDGRAFLEKNNKQYDMIIFALPDSITLLANQSSLRLENYLFTAEGIAQVRKHLTSLGIFSFYNYFSERWPIDRLANTLQYTFQHPPCLDILQKNGLKTAVLTINNHPNNLICNRYWQPADTRYLTPSTDDHPFVHYKENQLTPFYYIILILIALTALLSLKMIKGSYRSLFVYRDFFFMGSAFLLFETKSIAAFALLFGSTWFVNALVFSGILSVVYIAIELSHRFRFSKMILFFLLFLSLWIAWRIPNAALLLLPLGIRFIVASLLAFSPILFANLIFADRFRNTAHSTHAFSANMLGALVGGVLEYSALLFGYHQLLLISGGLYLLSFI